MNIYLVRSHSRGIKPGFTLIELLVVIAIIALLAAILFPVFGRVRENARKSSCQSNLKQIGLGLLQYIQDYDETLPASAYGSNANIDLSSTLATGGDMYKWMDAIYPYVKSAQIFDCPSRQDRQYGTFTPVKQYVYGDSDKYGSYALNRMYNAATTTGNVGATNTAFRGPSSNFDNSGSGNIWLTKNSEVQNPATTVWVLERSGGSTIPFRVGCGTTGNCGFGTGATPMSIAIDNVATPGGGGGSTDMRLFPGTQYSGQIIARHLETTNVLWCDGHVKAMKLEALIERGNIWSNGGNIYAGGTSTGNQSLRFFTNSDD